MKQLKHTKQTQKKEKYTQDFNIPLLKQLPNRVSSKYSAYCLCYFLSNYGGNSLTELSLQMGGVNVKNQQKGLLFIG
jgi:hypothetical protein